MPTLTELAARISFLAVPAVAGILITAGLLVVSRDWRLNVWALILQYFFVVVLLTRQIRLEVAAVKGLIGWLICMVFYVTERRVSLLRQPVVTEQERRSSGLPPQTPLKRWRRWVMSARASFSLLAGILIAVAAYTATLRFPLPEVSTDVTLACYLLAGLGLLLIGMSESPMQVGIGLLTFISGFDLFYVALEPSLAVAGLFGAVSFLIALASAYLRTAQAITGEEEVL